MKDWPKERWRKLYLREALEQRLWSVVARGLRDYLIRVAEDDGALIRDSDDPVEALLLALGAHPDEAELVRAAIVLLRRDGFLAGGARSLFVHNLPAAQAWEPRVVVPAEAEVAATPTSARASNERVRRFRERQRHAAKTDANAMPGVASSVTSPVTSGVTTPVTGVTSSVTEAIAGNVTASRGSRKLKSSGSFLDLQKDQQTDHPRRSSRASAVTASVTSAVTSVTSSVTSGASLAAETGDDGDDDQLGLLCDPEEREKTSIKDRATALRDHPALAATTRPERWPEVIGVAEAYARGSGLPEQRLGEHDSDPGVRAILKLYVAGFTQPELERVAEFMPKQTWWRNKSLGLASLSAEVVRRNLAAAMAGELSPRLAKVLEDVQRRLEAG